MIIIEDDPDIRTSIASMFDKSGFRVQAYATGEAGVEAVLKYRPQVLILDLTLPDIDGYEVARRVRLFSNAYILMITARAQELDVVLGLGAGADDYMTKPFRAWELRYRVEALLRRPRLRTGTTDLTASAIPLQSESEPGSADTEPPEETNQTPLTHNGLRLDPAARTVEVDGTELRLTPSEFDLLHTLLRGRRTAHTKADLLAVLHGGFSPPEQRLRQSDNQLVQAHIANLRRKLGDAAASPRWIETVHGYGYRLAATLGDFA